MNSYHVRRVEQFLLDFPDVTSRQTSLALNNRTIFSAYVLLHSRYWGQMQGGVRSRDNQAYDTLAPVIVDHTKRLGAGVGIEYEIPAARWHCNARRRPSRKRQAEFTQPSAPKRARFSVPIPSERPTPPMEPEKTFECQCCYFDQPLQQQVVCPKVSNHVFCHRCILNVVSDQLQGGESQMSCISTCIPRCKAIFHSYQLQFLERPLLERMEDIERDKELEKAGLTDLAKCSHCGFKASYPPIEKAPFFWCHGEKDGKKCGKITCRDCGDKAHWGYTCYLWTTVKMERDEGEILRVVQEALTKAIMRNCL